MGTLESFKANIDAFLKRSGLKPSTFGRLALNDSKFVYSLLNKKRSPHIRTIEKAEAWMKSWKPGKKPRK